MKQILFLLISFFPLILSSQNWQNICSPGVTLYQNSLGEIQAFRLDSVQAPGNGDTIFYSYRTIRDTQPCADTSHGSILGFKVYKSSIGWFCFFNKYWDTLQINTNASLGESWKFCNLPDSGYVEATVSEILTDTILDIPDSVKTILFQAYDSTGNTLAHVINGRTVSLSKSHGMNVMADAYLLPDAFSKYELAGTTIPEAGIPNLNERLVYDFNAGDEFHYQTADTPPGWYVTSIYYKRMITILTKEVSLSEGSVKYTASRCLHIYFVPWYNMGPPWVENFRDTINLEYPISDSWSDTSRMQLPGTFIRRPFYYSDQVAHRYLRDFNGPISRQRQCIRENIYLYEDSCWDLTTRPGFYWAEYAAGLGCLTNGWGVYSSSKNNLIFYIDELVYYKKGEEEWGTRLATDCDQLLGINLMPGSNYTMNISLFPNPASDRITLQIESFQPGAKYKFTLIDFIGNEVYQTSITESPIHINLPNLSPGLYIWQVTGESETTIGKLLVE
jgi:hypothetical protein